MQVNFIISFNPLFLFWWNIRFPIFEEIIDYLKNEMVKFVTVTTFKLRCWYDVLKKLYSLKKHFDDF